MIESAKPRLLLVEDNDDDALLIETSLGRESFELKRASTAAEACERIESWKPDVVLLDLVLPDATGVATMRRLRAAEQNVPIIVLTGVEDREWESRSLDLGVSAHLFKGDLKRPGVLEGTLRRILADPRPGYDLLESRHQLTMALRSSRAGVWSWDFTSDTLYWGGPIRPLNGVTETRVQSREQFLSQVSEEDRDSIRDFFDSLRQAEDFQQAEFVMAAKPEYTLRISGRPMRVETEREPHIVGILADITTERTQEAKRARLERRVVETQHLESLEVLAGGVAHDFNNLLMGILGNLSLIRRELEEHPSASRWLDNMEAATIEASELTQQLLAFSGKGRFVVTDLDLTRMVSRAEPLLQTALHPNARLSIRSPKRNVFVNGDETQLRQVLVNLVRNASEALQGNAGTIVVSTGHEKLDSRSAYLRVADTGCGLAPGTTEKIFDPFFTTKAGGSGLGLAAAQGIVRSHKGRIDIQSVPEVGTTIRVRLPAVETETEKVFAEHGEATGRTALVADDHRAVRQVVARYLENRGFEVTTARDGREALELFNIRPRQLDLLVLDLSMPCLSGEDLADEILRSEPKTPIILMSGFNEREIRTDLTDRIVGFLQKPFRDEELTALIDRSRDFAGKRA